MATPGQREGRRLGRKYLALGLSEPGALQSQKGQPATQLSVIGRWPWWLLRGDRSLCPWRGLLFSRVRHLVLHLGFTNSSLSMENLTAPKTAIPVPTWRPRNPSLLELGGQNRVPPQEDREGEATPPQSGRDLRQGMAITGWPKLLGWPGGGGRKGRGVRACSDFRLYHLDANYCDFPSVSPASTTGLRAIS